MIERKAHVPTANAAKYMTQLCKHWAHKLDVELDERRGIVRFETAVVTMEPADGALIVHLLANDAATVRKIEGVIEKHLERFAFREAPLRFPWQSCSSSELLTARR